jgi:hypothetical protein
VSFSFHDSHGGELGTNPAHRGLFDPRTSVILCGSGRALLNWVAYGLVAEHPGGFIWGHVRLDGEVLEDSDLLKTQLIPPDRLITVSPRDLVRDERAGNVAMNGLLRSEKDDDLVRGFADFLRLPRQTQELISRLPRDGPRPVLVLSGAQRLGPLYASEAVGPTLDAIVRSGGSVLMIWAEAPVSGRLHFDHILHLKGEEPSRWKEGSLTVERGWPSGPLRTGATVGLQDLAPVAGVLGKSW